MTLLARVARVLGDHDIPFALIGAGALAAHGVARSTLDLDLLTTDTRVLDFALWTPLVTDAAIDIRPGGPSDPLAGVVRWRHGEDREIDLVVGRFEWQAEAVRRARPVRVEDIDVPVVEAADLVLLKLYAGGLQDAWDIEQLLSAEGREQLVSEVEARIGVLPSDAARLWERIRRDANREG